MWKDFVQHVVHTRLEKYMIQLLSYDKAKRIKLGRIGEGPVGSSMVDFRDWKEEEAFRHLQCRLMTATPDWFFFFSVSLGIKGGFQRFATLQYKLSRLPPAIQECTAMYLPVVVCVRTYLIQYVSYHYIHTIPFSEPIQRGRPRGIGVALVRNSEAAIRSYYFSAKEELTLKQSGRKTKGTRKSLKDPFSLVADCRHPSFSC